MGQDGLGRAGIGARGGEHTPSSRRTDCYTPRLAGAFIRHSGSIARRGCMVTVTTCIPLTDFVLHQPMVLGSMTMEFDPLGRGKTHRPPRCTLQVVFVVAASALSDKQR